MCATTYCNGESSTMVLAADAGGRGLGVVNGRAKANTPNIGISLPGTGEAPVAPVFEDDSAKTVTLRGDKIAGIYRHCGSLCGAEIPTEVRRKA
ncbi:MAG: hypothetical protein IPN98_02660 [Propionivibrio sp.]|nr:hypothetical protein [Propionivibrio sp.]